VVGEARPAAIGLEPRELGKPLRDHEEVACGAHARDQRGHANLERDLELELLAGRNRVRQGDPHLRGIARDERSVGALEQIGAVGKPQALQRDPALALEPAVADARAALAHEHRVRVREGIGVEVEVELVDGDAARVAPVDEGTAVHALVLDVELRAQPVALLRLGMLGASDRARAGRCQRREHWPRNPHGAPRHGQSLRPALALQLD
jgi:hypothetical protein